MKLLWINELGSGDAYAHAYIVGDAAEAERVFRSVGHADHAGDWPRPFVCAEDGWRDMLSGRPYKGRRNLSAIFESAEDKRDLTRG